MKEGSTSLNVQGKVFHNAKSEIIVKHEASELWKQRLEVEVFTEIGTLLRLVGNVSGYTGSISVGFCEKGVKHSQS